MNADTVLIEDDDVDMLEPVEVSDDNIDTGQKQNSSKSVDTIILDEDSSPAPTNNEAVIASDNDSSPIATNDEVVTINNKVPSPADTNDDIVAVNDKDASPAAIHEEIVSDKAKNSSFAGLLRNSTLLNKIVKRCLTMENNAGMSRVINKTLLPLYADADNKLKASEKFSDLLNKILFNLKYDPNHKFLHIKSLCEELKAGKYRRKVPFITLSTDLEKTNGFIPGRDQHTRYNLRKKRTKARNINFDDYNFRKKRRKTSNANKKTAIINLDNSDDECVIDLDVDDDAVVVTDVDDGHDTIVARDNENDHDDIAADNEENAPDRIVASNDEDVHDDIVADSDKNRHDNTVTDNNGDDDEVNNDDVMVVDDNSDVVSDLSNKENNIVEENENDKTPTTPTDKTTATFDCKVLGNNINNKTNTYISKDNEEIRNTTNGELSTSNNKNETANTSNSELLIPKKSVNSDRHSLEFSRAIAIEKQIAICKDKIAQLEKEEVTANNFCSPYILCDKYKTKIVQLYKKLCKLTGHGDVSLTKQRVVRLQVIDGHPPGPTRRLEEFLNSTIDETGNVPLPDFQDVVNCVSEADTADRLGWKKEQIMREAIALFTQCGHALRKSRQRREYKDLIHLEKQVKQDDPDDYDPANDDPLLHAKLEENKLIAKANEDEIMERFVQMERLPKDSQAIIPRVCNILRINPGDDSDTDSELDLTPPKISKTSEIQHNQNTNKEISNETPDVNRATESSSNLPTNIQHEKRVVIYPPAMGTTLDKHVNISTIQCAIDKIVKNAFNAMSNNAKITSSQTILNITQGDKTITVTPKLTNMTTKYPHYTATQNALNITINNLTNTNTPYAINAITPNPINAHINSINTTTQYVTNSPVNITSQNKTIIITPNLTNTATLNPTIYNQVNTPTAQYTPVNVVTQNNTITMTPHFTNRIIQNPLYVTTENTLNTINNTIQNNPNNPNYINNPIKKPETHIMWSNTLQKVGSSNRYVVSFDSSTSQNNAKEKKDDHKIIATDSSITDRENVNGKTEGSIKAEPIDSEADPNTINSENVKLEIEEDSVKEEPIDTNTYGIRFDSSPSQDNAKDDHDITVADLNTPDSESVKLEIEEDIVKEEPIDKNTYGIRFDSSLSQDNAKDDHDVTVADPNKPDSESVKLEIEEDIVKEEPIDKNTYGIRFDSSPSQDNAKDDRDITVADPNTPDSENVRVKTEDSVKNEPIDISAMLSALGDNYLTTIFDIEDPFLVIEISSDSSSDEES